jgi:membrane protein YqaA with SNARE-associated domain
LSYLTLFVVGFLAATLLPASSEVLLLTLYQQGGGAVPLWIVATLGNSLGSCVNWWLGKEISRFRERAWFPVTAAQLNRAEKHFNRYGYWSLLFAWLPVVGDPLTFVAGILRVRLLLFVTLVVVGKGSRYAVLLLIASQLV